MILNAAWREHIDCRVADAPRNDGEERKKRQ